MILARAETVACLRAKTRKRDERKRLLTTPKLVQKLKERLGPADRST